MFSKLAFYFPFFAFLLVTVLSNAQVKPTPPAERMKGLEQRMVLEQNSLVNHVKFRNIGPTVMSGRVDDIEANPADPTEFYVAYATGGLWHTTNNGQSFTPIFDSADVIGIGDIAVNWNQQGKRTIWIGTGEVNSSRSSYSGIGVFKSSDNGKHWEYLGLPGSNHIGKILLHPTNENIAWVAAQGPLYSAGKDRGVYKTTDGGRTWKHSLYIDDNTGVVEMEINPKNPNEIYAAAWYRTRRAWNFEESGSTSGIYKSTDGGDTWKLLSTAGSGFPNGNHVGRIGLAVFPKDPNIIYAVVDNQTPKPDTSKRDTALYLLDDLKNLSMEEFASLNEAKLDSFLKRNRLYPKYNSKTVKEMVALQKIKPTSLYDYLYINTGFEGTPIGAEIYRSNDAGNSWKKVNEKDIQTFFTYGYYFGKIYVSPYNPDKLYNLGVYLHLSTDGGKTWKVVDKPNVHADHHALWINPDKDSHVINGNDGGINITYDDGENWFKANTPAVGQFYAITVDHAKPYNVYGGLQDNGVWYLPSQMRRNRFAGSGLGLSNNNEMNLGGGDGMYVQVDKRNNAIVYYGSQFGNYSRTNRFNREETKRITPRHELGEKPMRFNWQSPILLSTHNNDILYFGSNKLFRSFNQGDTMMALTGDLSKGGRQGDVPYGTITTISESPLNFGVVYAGTDDGNVHVTRDAGNTWINIANAKKKGKSLPQDLWVSRVVASAHSEARVYVTLNGYRFDHFKPYVFVSEDFGNTWTALGTDLPYEPVNVIREDPKNENILYVGTDGGLYVSLNKGRSFMKWTSGMPASIPVHDIAIQEIENEIVIGTHGRSIYIAKLDEVQKLVQ